MKINPTFRSLLDKSLASMLSAIEIYNKPYFQYREDTFAILAVNAWELLFKAYYLKLNKYNIKCLYVHEPQRKKNGEKSKKQRIALNRSGNPKTISVFEIINKLKGKNELPFNLYTNIEALIELRDNSIHFYNVDSMSKLIQELGFACIKNYIGIVKVWGLPISFSKYNLYLMPLAYVDNKKFADGVVTSEMSNFLNLIKTKLEKEDDDKNFDIAIAIDIDFKKNNSLNAISVSKGENGIPIVLKEEDLRKRYPFTYQVVVGKCRLRYSDFKQNKLFNQRMKALKTNSALCRKRMLDPNNEKSQSQTWYSPSILNELDKFYTKK